MRLQKEPAHIEKQTHSFKAGSHGIQRVGRLFRFDITTNLFEHLPRIEHDPFAVVAVIELDRSKAQGSK